MSSLHRREITTKVRPFLEFDFVFFLPGPLAILMSMLLCLSTGMQVENKSFFNLFLFLGWKWFLKDFRTYKVPRIMKPNNHRV